VVPGTGTLLERIKMRGRAEEKDIAHSFLEGLNGYYTAFPSILQAKYSVDVWRLDVSDLDIRKGEGKARFLDEAKTFFDA
jgi:deoxyadenosine/deoxycytidine kinase